jgi:hypothetical protein
MGTGFFLRVLLAPNALVIWLLYFIAAALLLLQLPLQGSLPGNWDSWLYLYLFNYYPDYILSKLGLQPLYLPFYPESTPPFLFGEPSFFNSFIFLPFQWITQSPLWGYYLFTASVLALNGTGMYFISKVLFRSRLTAWLTGLLFMFSNYLLCSLDQQNVLSVYPALFSIGFLLLFHQNAQGKYLILSAIMAAVQLYCSAYHFFFLFTTLAALTVLHIHYSLQLFKRPVFWMSLTIIAGAVLPFARYYLFNDLEHKAYNFVDQRTLQSLSLHVRDLFQAHPYNLIYGNSEDQNLIYYIHAVSPGIVLSVLALVCWQQQSLLQKWVIALLILISVCLAVGPVWKFGDTSIGSPLYCLMNVLGLDNFMRTPVRAIMILLVTACLLAGKVMSDIFQKSRLIFLAVLLLWGIENIPGKFQRFNSSDYLEVPVEVMSAAQHAGKDDVLWLQPSSINTASGLETGLGEVNREYIYMYWQTSFEKNMVNGMNGYVPRINLDIRTRGLQGNMRIRSIYVENMEPK